MQAIISDIIVNQAVNSGNLLVSQTLDNSSSNSISFSEMLGSLQSQSDSQTEKTQNENKIESEQTKKVENTSDSEKTQKTGASEKSEETKTSETDSKKSSLNKDESEKTAKKYGSEAQNEELNKAGNVKSQKNPADYSSKKVSVQKDETKKTAFDDKTIASKKQILEDEADKAALVQEKALDSNEATQLANKAAAFVPAENSVQVKDESLNVDAESLLNSEITAINPDSSTADVELNAKDKISIIDMRTKLEDKAVEGEQKTQKAPVKVEFNPDNTATVTMELAEQAAGENILSLDNQTAASTNSNFQAMVNNQIQANVPEFVKAGTILLQDNDKGTINLVLHPDDLGNVKIHLSMDGKTISAHITVNTKEALEVFKDNAQTLREAFAKNGFDTANFDVSYNGNSNGQNQNYKEMYDGMEYIARQAYNDYAGGADDGYIQEAWEKSQNSEYLINIVA